MTDVEELWALSVDDGRLRLRYYRTHPHRYELAIDDGRRTVTIEVHGAQVMRVHDTAGGPVHV